jgi:hypothetical protein
MDLLRIGEISMMTKYVLAVDPGKATGVVLFEWNQGSDPRVVRTAEVQPNEFAKFVRQAIDLCLEFEMDLETDLIVVCERFIINAQTVRNSQAPYSLEQIGVLKQCLRDAGMSEESILWQSPADAKAMFPNPALKKIGYWHKGGEGHALDAMRHGLLCLVKRGWKPTSLLS